MRIIFHKLNSQTQALYTHTLVHNVNLPTEMMMGVVGKEEKFEVVA